MDFPKLQVKVRTLSGKGPSRRLRGAGQAPAVLYGPGVDAIPLVITPKELSQALAGPLHTNTVVELHIAGGDKGQPQSCTAMVKDHQYHPVSRNLLHVDFLAVDVSKPIDVKIPLRITGRSVGVQAGGALSAPLRDLPLSCLPANIPAEIVLDVTALKINDKITVKDLELPANVLVTLDPETALVVVQAPRKEEAAAASAEGAESEEDAKGEGGDSKDGE